jgi:hypothetical protein
MKKIFSWFTAAICTFSIMSTNASYAEQIKDNLWEKFIKYDLCITDYRALTDEEKELCKFISILNRRQMIILSVNVQGVYLQGTMLVRELRLNSLKMHMEYGIITLSIRTAGKLISTAFPM